MDHSSKRKANELIERATAMVARSEELIEMATANTVASMQLCRVTKGLAGATEAARRRHDAVHRGAPLVFTGNPTLNFDGEATVLSS